MKFVCEHYPQLYVRDVGVRFRDGQAEVTDKAAIEALKRLPDEYGIRAVGGRPSKSDD